MSEEEKVFKDPVHGYIYVHQPLIWDLINTREMQRLRRIRQLGTTYVAYPGGDHSRFSHSLGVYEVIRQILAAFDRNAYPWDEDDNLLAMAAGLLHDVGHGPFSHAVEKVVGLRHERWSEAIILDAATEVHQVLEHHRPGFAQAVADVIAKRHPHRLVVSLVSGQLDADRLDYLMRDSVATGVDYGKFDLARIIRIMEPVDDRIVVRQSGLRTLEAYLLARYFMYWQVYFHPVSRSAEVVLRSILQRARDLAGLGEEPPFPHPALASLLRETVGLADYLRLDDAVFLNAFNVWQDAADPVLRDLCRRFLDRRLLDYREYPEFRPMWWQRVLRAADASGFDSRYYCAIDETGTVYYDYYLGGGNRQGEAIWLWDRNTRSLVETSEVSSPVRTIAAETRVARRVYFPREIGEQVD
ncbi:MAG: HD domain-containing protein [Thermaerobacter sp.]|nr:HD domain-containing protein [Thermaerobacter sp.]